MANAKALHRSTENKVIAGVAGGLGEYFEVDPIVFRIIFVLLAVFGASGVVIYIILWILIPEKNEKRSSDLGENIKSGANKMASELKDASETRNNVRLIGGLIIILVGVVFLLQEFFPFWHIGFDKLWPLIVIALGVAILKRPEHNTEKTNEKEKK